MSYQETWKDSAPLIEHLFPNKRRKNMNTFQERGIMMQLSCIHLRSVLAPGHTMSFPRIIGGEESIYNHEKHFVGTPSKERRAGLSLVYEA